MAEHLLSQKTAVDTAACAENCFTDVEFRQLEQLTKILLPLKEISD